MSPPPPSAVHPPRSGAPREPFRAEPAHPRAHRPPPDRPRGRRAPDGQPPRRRVQGAAAPRERGHEALLRHDQRRDHADLRRHGRARGGDRQHAVAGRPGAGRHDRRVRRPVREDRRGLRRGGHAARGRVGPGGRAGRGRARLAASIAGPEGRPAHAQRDVHRRHQRHPGARRRRARMPRPTP